MDHTEVVINITPVVDDGDDRSTEVAGGLQSIIVDARAITTAEDDHNDCVICLEPLYDDSLAKTVKFSCAHELHMTCALKFVEDKLRKNVDITCPTCRFVQCAKRTQTYKYMQCHFGIQAPTTSSTDDPYTLGGFETHIVPRAQPPRRQSSYHRSASTKVLSCVTFVMVIAIFGLVLFAIYVVRQNSQ